MSAVEFTKEQEKRLREVNPLAEEIIASNKAAVQNAKNRARSKLTGKIRNGIIRSGQFRYPLEALTETTDYLQFTIVEYQPTKVASGGSLVGQPGSRRIGPAGTKDKAKKILGSIIMQMPANIQDGNAVDYGESKMNTLMGAAAGLIGSTIEGGGEALSAMLKGDDAGYEKATKDMTKEMKNTVGTDSSIMDAASQFVSAKATSAAIGALGGNVSAADILARQTGQIFNPNMELLFNGPTLRSFNFSFKMTPRSPSEAQECKNIIRSFKSNMAPKTKNTGSLGGSGMFLKTPNVFELRYKKGNGDHPFLHKFKQCFLTNVSVNYTGEGVYATYDDASPISMQIDLSFKELEPIYDVDYDDAGGVGF
tara:strand:+ start:1634 stop:2731 length:1098 start_codon:yes stop_codon:yes gene_type:complete